MENSELKIASHYNFYNATLYVKCEEKDGAIYWYGDNSDNLKKITTSTTRGCGRISRYVGNPWKRISKKAAAEILAKYGITAEQFIAYTNEEPELMSELAAQRAEEERVETLNFFLSLPLTSNEALEIATNAEIALATKAAVKQSETEIKTLEVTAKTSKDGKIITYLNGKHIAKRRIEDEMLRAVAGSAVLDENGVVKFTDAVIKIEESLLKSSFPYCYHKAPNFFKGKAQIVYPVQEPKNFKAAQSNLPSGDITVESGAEAFALVAKYFPSGLEFDGIDYGYRGETHFCFFNDSANLSLIALSDESNRRIEEVRVQEGGNIRLAVIIESKKNVDKPLVKTSNVEKTAEKKKAADDAEKNLKTSQKTVAADKSQRWLENAKTDAAGRYYIVPELAYKNFEANANWNPCFYIVTNEFKLKRVGLKFAVALATLGQAIEISKNDVAALKK